MGRATQLALGTASLLAATGLLAACGDEPAPGGPVRIATTVAPITSLVAAVAGPEAIITGLVPEGTNSHTFEPRPSAAKTLAEADIVFVNGLELEQPIDDLALRVGRDTTPIVRLGNAVLPESDWIYDVSFPRSGGTPNPHLWTDPLLAKRYVEVIRDELAKRDGDHAAAYRANAARLIARIDAFDAALADATATIPAADRKLLTYHDAYAYVARDYGWTVVGAIEPSDFTEPTAKDVTRLIRQIREARVPAIFGSEVFPSPVLERIATETGAIYVDDLRDDDLPGAPGEATHSWLGLVRFDYVTMVEALGGDASALRSIPLGGLATDTATYPQ